MKILRVALLAAAVSTLPSARGQLADVPVEHTARHTFSGAATVAAQ